MPQTILIVDDEKRLVSLVQSYLAQEGYRVVAAYNGKDALPLAQKEKPDLIILDIMLDRDSREVQVANRSVDLTPSEVDLLAAVMSTPGRVYSRLDLLDVIQGVRYEGYERTIDTHIKNLRAKIEVDPRNPHYIETMYGVGYRLNKG